MDIKYIVIEWLDNSSVDDFVSDLIDELYSSEDNFNNCDTTSGQRIYSYDEIKNIVEDTIKKCKNSSDRCSECGKLINDENWDRSYEQREFWGSPCYETIITGYTCDNCGNSEKW